MIRKTPNVIGQFVFRAPGLFFWCVVFQERMVQVASTQMRGVGKGDIVGQVAFISSLLEIAA
jgi:hypothetical protein